MFLGKVVLVTGGLGFMGANFINLLLKEAEDTVVVNLDAMTYAASKERLLAVQNQENYHFIRGNVCDEPLLYEIFATYKIDTVVHFAAESHVDRSIENARDFVLSNVFGTFTLLEVCRRQQKKIHFHHISTDEVFGDKKEGLVLETSPYKPSSPYAASKASSDHFVHSFARTYEMSVTMSHSCNNFGPFQDREKFIPKAIDCFLDKRPFPLYGKGDQVREWIYVEDHSRAILHILKIGKQGSFNIGSNERLTNRQTLTVIIKALADKFDSDAEGLADLVQQVEDRAGHDVRYAVDSTKIRASGFKEKYSFAQGLESTIQEMICLKSSGV